MNQSLRRSFVGFHLVLAIVVFVQSVFTAIKAFSVEPEAHWLLFGLASVEAVAAILFVIPVTLRFGGVALCLVFFVAFTIHAIIGEFELQLLVYCAGTVFILFHGAGYSHRASGIHKPSQD
jgi:hypothetical protein